MESWQVLTQPRHKQERPLTKKPEAQKELAAATQAKLAVANDSATAAAASAVVAIQNKDAVQAGADVLKLTGEALTKRSAAIAETSASAAATKAAMGNNLAATGAAITSIHKAANGDAFAAASQASIAVEKLTSNSALGAVANAVVLTTSKGKLAEKREEVKKNAETALSTDAPTSKRAKAWLDLSASAYQYAFMARSIGNAAVKVGQFGLGKLGTVAATAAPALKAQGALAKVAASPLGKLFAGLNKWIPLLNVVGVAISGKNAIDVFRSDKSSTASKALSVASVGMALGSLVAGLTIGFWPFLGVVVASVLVDIGLAETRERDRAIGDTDAVMRDRFAHPGRGLADLAGWVGNTGLDIGKLAVTNLKSGFESLKKRFAGEAAAPAAAR